MISLRRAFWLVAILLGSGVFFSASQSYAIPEKDVRFAVDVAEKYAKANDWEAARQIYEDLLGQIDPGLNIRGRYQQALRRCWQARRHNDISYKTEVLSLDYGQALRIGSLITSTLLDGSVDKKKVDPNTLLKKGIEELEAALSDVKFRQANVKHGDFVGFQQKLKKLASEARGLTRKKMMEKIGQIALAAEIELGIDPTVTIMELACGACYAIDEYTVYLTPNQLRDLANSLTQSESTSVGIRLAVRDNKIVVRTVDMDSPARQVINENDEIVSVDKQPVMNLNLSEIAKLLHGPAGSMVDVEVYSPLDDSTTTYRIGRQAPLTSVKFGVYPGSGYGLLTVTGFTDTTVQDIDQHLKQTNVKGLILDLRGNNGGLVEGAIDTAKRFLATGIITSSVNQDTKQNFVYHAKNPNANGTPLIVLVDNDTASAAEVLAGALKDNNRATLIGQTTFGKGCTQCVLKLPNAMGGVPTGGMKLTVARFFSPKGLPYTGRGVVPHIFIDERIAASQASPTGDAYLDRAIDELNRMLMMTK